VVLLAGFARLGEDALRWQARMIARDLPKFVLPALRALATRQLTRIKKSSKDVARVAGLPVNARWTREMLTHDPRLDLTNIKAPVLAITGDKDVQVDPADLEVIRQLVPGEVEIHRPADLTHVLRRDPGKPSMRSYRQLLRHPVDAALLAHVTGWLAHRLPGIPHDTTLRREMT
jgi:pimeloyl-ACP methyl ester carboxylesterase